jgi:hypothetical protein
MIKKIIILTVLIFSACCLNAQDKGFGMGLLIGEPSAITGKYWVTDNNAVTGSVGWSFIRDNAIHLSADYLYHFNKFENSKFIFYAGLGAKLNLGTKSNIKPKIGGRVPLGVCYMIRDIQSDIFLEVVPMLEVTPEIRISGSGGIGFRYFFN